jgi:uncharacterized protein YgiM (DUF1202 family)
MAKYMVNENGVDREMTANEVELYETAIAETQAQKDAQAKAEADKQKLKTATLAKLGLTADEVAALLS